MPSLFEFSQAITKLNKEKKFVETLKYFKENKAEFTAEQIGSNDYLISAMISALRHTQNIDNAFKFIELYKIRIDHNTKEIVLSAYGWLLYSKFKSENQHSDEHEAESEVFDDEEGAVSPSVHFTKSDIIKKIESYLPLIINIHNEYGYSILSILFTSVIKAEKKKANANWRFVNDFCDLISPEILHTDCRSIEVERKGIKKPMELASDRETWYSYKSKALMKLGKYQECYEISKKALASFEKFHYSNDNWFARRIALSKKHLGNPADAITELQAVLKKKKEWFIQKELAVLYLESGDNKQSFKLAIDAINNFGDLEYKVDLLFLLGELLKGQGEMDLAYKHYSLAQLLRVNEEWSIPQKLITALTDFNRPYIPIEKIKDLTTELKKYWNTFKQEIGKPIVDNNRRYSGIIDKILHNDEKGADGFIKYEGKKSIYFRLNPVDEMTKSIILGLRVEFKILPATGDKKEKAINLRFE